jgi:carbon storage regulator
MLVLSRKCGEKIVIGTDTVIQVLDTQGDRVRLGITAPVHTKIHREEIFWRIEQAHKPVAVGAEESPYFSRCW